MHTHRTVGAGVLAAVLVSAALAVALAGPAGAAGPDRGASAMAAGATSPDAGFDSDQYTEAEGDVASITVTMTDTDTATVNVGSTEAGYLARTQVTDGDGDGEVTLLVNLFEAGGWRGTPPSGVYDTADPDDSVSVTRETQTLGDPLAPFAYDLNVSVDGVVYSAATLFVEERETGTARTISAPDGTAPSDVTSGAAVADTVAVGDYVAVQVEATGVFGYLRDASDLGAGTQGLTLEVVQTNPQPNEAPRELDPADGTLVPAPDRDSFFVVFDTDAVGVDPGERYRATFTVDETNPLTDGTESVETTFEIREVTAAIDDSRAPDPESNEPITGSTTLAAGSELRVRIESQNPNEPLVDRQTVTVEAGGSWTATFDLSGLSDGTDLQTTVTHDGEELGGPTTLTVGGGSASFEITAVDVPDTIVAGETVSASATVRNTGEVEGTATVELRVSGRVVDSQELTLAAGESRQSTFTISTEGVPTGTYDYTVAVGSDQATGTVDVVESTTRPPTTEPPTTEPATVPPTTAPPTVPPTTAPPTVPPTTAPPTVPPTTAPPTVPPTTEPPTVPPTTTEPRTSTAPPRTPVTATSPDRTTVPTATVTGSSVGTNVTTTTNASNATNATTTTDDEADGTAIQFDAEGSPGFVPATAVVALAVALWLRRRR
jgi:hypothetical protein